VDESRNLLLDIPDCNEILDIDPILIGEKSTVKPLKAQTNTQFLL